jgi:hypothetical protein
MPILICNLSNWIRFMDHNCDMTATCVEIPVKFLTASH